MEGSAVVVWLAQLHPMSPYAHEREGAWLWEHPPLAFLPGAVGWFTSAPPPHALELLIYKARIM